MFSRGDDEAGDCECEDGQTAGDAQDAQHDVKQRRSPRVAIRLIGNLDRRRELGHLIAGDAHADPPVCVGDDRRPLLKMKQPVATIRLLK